MFSYFINLFTNACVNKARGGVMSEWGAPFEEIEVNN